jgi:transcriptional regulator with XRE-family HTH domain
VTSDPGPFSLSGALRRARRIADMSQREMATAASIARSTLAAAEASTRDLPVSALARAAAVAGLRLALLDAEGTEVAPMDDDAVRDMGSRRFPAHLDTRYSEEDWWHGQERYSREQPWYTFDRRRDLRDRFRAQDGTPEDHQLPQPGDSPEERSAARRRAALRRVHEEWEERRAAGRLPASEPWICDCPAACAHLEDWQGPPRHSDGCRCRCDPC